MKKIWTTGLALLVLGGFAVQASAADYAYTQWVKTGSVYRAPVETCFWELWGYDDYGNKVVQLEYKQTFGVFRCMQP